MWDQRLLRHLHSLKLRIIPTYVGSTGVDAINVGNQPNHSHVCGINEAFGLCWEDVDESFPRMWDQRLLRHLHSLKLRIIPTYVGSTGVDAINVGNQPNHSHVCGINESTSSSRSPRSESFPRMWDQRYLQVFIFTYGRIIPTYVGSTFGLRPEHRTEPNHSHVCGINPFFGVTRERYLESFPRMWDQLPETHTYLYDGRIIPTYVGSTMKRAELKAFRTNHSHVCGINAMLPPLALDFFESFPRMWDQQNLESVLLLQKRIIPTYVGSTRQTE